MEFYDKAKIEQIKALRRGRSNATQQQEELKELNFYNSNAADANDNNEEEPSNDGYTKTRFDLEEEKQLGCYDEDGYFVYNKDTRDREEGHHSKMIHASKVSRDEMKRKLGIEDVDTFISKHALPNKMMRTSMKDNQEYSDDEDEPESLRDPWIDGLEKDERAHFKNAEQQEKLLVAKEKEKKKLEDRLEHRFGTNMTAEERLRTLIKLMNEYEVKTPAHLIIRIKELGVKEVESDNVMTEKEKLNKKKTFQKSVKLRPQTLKKLNDVTELCDELTLSGYQIYDEPMEVLLSMLHTE